MTISQQPCYLANGANNPYCCSNPLNGIAQTGTVVVCSSWSGAHFEAQFGLQYGVLEAEAKVNIPGATGADLFFGAYAF